ncbi:MAG: DUF4157 domain-containing protein [Chitinophagaceae bacterium]
MNKKVKCETADECSAASTTANAVKVQTKLKVGAVDDPLEHEADVMANKVMSMQPVSAVESSGTQNIQRKCSHCEEEDKAQRKPLSSFIQRKETGAGTVAGDAITSQVSSSKGRGESMDDGTKSFMESRFGTDFNGVKIHNDTESIQMNRELSAKAFTVGSDIYFNEGQYQPHSSEGKNLLAHELTHTIQQGGGIERKIQKAPKPKKTVWLHIGFDSSATPNKATMKKLKASIAAMKAALADCCKNKTKACDIQVKTLYDWNQKDKTAPTDKDYDGDVAADSTLRDKNINNINTGVAGGVKLLVTGSTLSQTWQGVRIGANANTDSAADNIIWDVNAAPVQTLPHEVGHVADYTGGDIEGGDHHSDPNNLMSRGDIRNAGAAPDTDWCDKVAALAK